MFVLVALFTRTHRSLHSWIRTELVGQLLKSRSGQLLQRSAPDESRRLENFSEGMSNAGTYQHCFSHPIRPTYIVLCTASRLGAR